MPDLLLAYSLNISPQRCSGIGTCALQQLHWADRVHPAMCPLHKSSPVSFNKMWPHPPTHPLTLLAYILWRWDCETIELCHTKPSTCTCWQAENIKALLNSWMNPSGWTELKANIIYNKTKTVSAAGLSNHLRGLFSLAEAMEDLVKSVFEPHVLQCFSKQIISKGVVAGLTSTNMCNMFFSSHLIAFRRSSRIGGDGSSCFPSPTWI